jgi:two-component system, NarL family, response regulator NreC
MIDIILADDHKVVRKGLKALLGAESDFRIVGEAGNGAEAVVLVEKLQPDILVLDLMMPGMNGLEVARSLSQSKSRAGIIILSMHNNEGYVTEALRTGVRAYVLKDAPPEELIYAIHEVIAGRCFMSASLSSKAIESYIHATRLSPVDPYSNLTRREQVVFLLSVQGLSTAEIAARLKLSPRTVETHRSNLMNKLNLHTKTQLIQFAIQKGLITANAD